MTRTEVMIASMEFNRQRTLALLDQVAEHPEALGWRPAPGRAHIAWQIMHIAVTEELFATERLGDASPRWPDLAERFRGGSTPDDDIPAVDEVRTTLASARENLKKSLATFGDADWDRIVARIRERELALGAVLQILSWHEAHHQGQAHITWNLYRATQA